MEANIALYTWTKVNLLSTQYTLGVGYTTLELGWIFLTASYSLEIKLGRVLQVSNHNEDSMMGILKSTLSAVYNVQMPLLVTAIDNHNYQQFCKKN